MREASRRIVALSCIRYVENSKKIEVDYIQDRVFYCLRKFREILGNCKIDFYEYGRSLLEPIDVITQQVWEQIPQSLSFDSDESAQKDLQSIHDKKMCCVLMLNQAALLDKAFHDNNESQRNLARYQNMIMILKAIASMSMERRKNTFWGQSVEKVYLCDAEYREYLIEKIIDISTRIQEIDPSHKIPSRFEVRRTIS